MPHVSLSQVVADNLFRMAKQRVNETEYDYPALGGRLEIPLLSTDGRESFVLDVRRNRINLAKGTYQTRGRRVVVLARLDFGGAPHRNPDDEVIPCPHIHLYREGYGDAWAYPLPAEFGAVADPWKLMKAFMRYVNVVRKPHIRKDLFT